MVLETRKDGTKFTNRPLKEAAERLQNLSGQYDDMQKQLVEQVMPSHTATSTKEPSVETVDTLTVIDLISVASAGLYLLQRLNSSS